MGRAKRKKGPAKERDDGRGAEEVKALEPEVSVVSDQDVGTGAESEEEEAEDTTEDERSDAVQGAGSKTRRDAAEEVQRKRTKVAYEEIRERRGARVEELREKEGKATAARSQAGEGASAEEPEVEPVQEEAGRRQPNDAGIVGEWQDPIRRRVPKRRTAMQIGSSDDEPAAGEAEAAIGDEDVGTKVEVWWGGQWYVGELMGRSEDNRKHLSEWAVKCDVDPGNLRTHGTVRRRRTDGGAVREASEMRRNECEGRKKKKGRLRKGGAQQVEEEDKGHDEVRKKTKRSREDEDEGDEGETRKRPRGEQQCRTRSASEEMIDEGRVQRDTG
jgi:hypothetical protein